MAKQFVPVEIEIDGVGPVSFHLPKALAPKPAKVKLQCNECQKKWTVAANPKAWPECPKCGGADFEVLS